MSAFANPTPVGAFGDVRKKIRAPQAAIFSTGRRMPRSRGKVITAPSWIPTSTGYSE